MGRARAAEPKRTLKLSLGVLRPVHRGVAFSQDQLRTGIFEVDRGDEFLGDQMWITRLKRCDRRLASRGGHPEVGRLRQRLLRADQRFGGAAFAQQSLGQSRSRRGTWSRAVVRLKFWTALAWRQGLLRLLTDAVYGRRKPGVWQAWNVDVAPGNKGGSGCGQVNEGSMVVGYRSGMRLMPLAAAVVMVLSAATARADDDAPKGDDQTVKLSPVALPIVVDGRIVNYIFTTVQIDLTPSADVIALRAKEPNFRDALVREGHRNPFVIPNDYNRLDDARLKAVLYRDAGAIIGARWVKGVEVLSETALHFVPRQAPKPKAAAVASPQADTEDSPDLINP